MKTSQKYFNSKIIHLDKFMLAGLKGFGILTLAIAIVVLVIISPPTNRLSQYFLSAPISLIILLLFLSTLLFHLSGSFGDFATLTFSLIIFCLPLIYKWQIGHYDGSTITGLFPFSDASGYFNDAQRLLFGSSFSDFSTRRPLFACLLSVILFIFQGNLQWALVFFTVMNGLATYVAAREVKITYGPLAASIFLLLGFFYFRIHTGRTTTESLGFALGAYGLYFLLRGVRENAISYLCFGLFTLTLALNARAGALLVLPMIFVWGIYIYWNDKKLRYRWIITAFGSIAFAFLINMILVKTIGSSTGSAFSNYWYTFYGLASGNKGWSQILIDFPGVQESQVQSIAIQKMINQPEIFIVGSFKAFLDYFKPNMGAFSFLFFDRNLGKNINLLLWSFTIIGMGLCLGKFKERTASLHLALFLGIILSVFLVPPIDSDSMRAYAATAPITALQVISCFQLFKINQSDENSCLQLNNLPFAKIQVPICIIIILLSTTVPLIIKLFSDIPRIFYNNPCSSGQEFISMKIIPGSIVNIVSDFELSASYLPNLRQSDLINSISLHSGGYPQLDEAILKMHPGQSIVVGINQADIQNQGSWGSNVYLIGPTKSFQPGILQACAFPTSDKWLVNYRFFYLKDEQGDQIHSQVVETQETKLTQYIWISAFTFIFILFILETIRFWEASILIKYIQVISLLLLLPIIFVKLHQTAIITQPLEIRDIPTEDSHPIGGYMYRIPLHTMWMSKNQVGSSPTTLLENGTILNGRNSEQSLIMELGTGRYSIDNGYIYLSSSDNSDPRTNNRDYKIVWPKPISKKVKYISIFFLIFGLFGLITSLFPDQLTKYIRYFSKYIQRMAFLFFSKAKSRIIYMNFTVSGIIKPFGGLLILLAILLRQFDIGPNKVPDWVRCILAIIGIFLLFIKHIKFNKEQI